MRRYRFGELEFSWDERKALQNARRHGVRFEEAATAFADPLGRVYDADHSETEVRFIVVGHSLAGRLLPAGARRKRRYNSHHQRTPAYAARARQLRSQCVKNTS